MQTTLHATATAFPMQAVITTLREAVQTARRWVEDQAMDERSRHLAGATDHEDLLRRERDCAAFERCNALIPRCH